MHFLCNLCDEIGVCLSHAALLHGMVECNMSNADSVILCFSSLYWISGVGVLIIGTLFGMTRIITTDIYSPELQLRLIEKYRATITFNAPHQLVLMMKSDRFSKTDISSLKRVFTGGRTPIKVQIKSKTVSYAIRSFIFR